MDQLSAFAVYQKKVKGVQSYQDNEALQDGSAGRYVRAKANSIKKKKAAPKPERVIRITAPPGYQGNASFNGNNSSSNPEEGDDLPLVSMANLSKKQKKKNKKRQEGNVTNGLSSSFNGFSEGNMELSDSTSPEVARVMNHAKKLASSVANGLKSKTPTKVAMPANSSSDSSAEETRPPLLPMPKKSASANVQALKTPTKKASLAAETSFTEKPKQKKKLSLVEPAASVSVLDASKEKKRKRNSELPRVTSNGNQPQKKAKTLQGAAVATSIMELLDNHPKDSDSTKIGKQVFEWLIAPTKVDTFMAKYWEQKPLLIKRGKQDYYKWLHSSEELDHILRNSVVRFGKNIDVTAYENGIRENIEIEGRAMPPAVWSYYAGGCSVRFLNPQSYVENIQKLNSLLQEYFGTFVGSNSYLTPPNSQGFAPHFDDIEAFIIQLEGKKHWKVYKPRDDSEVLPRFSSRNFNEENDSLGNPIIDVVLEEGDLLYLPRGYIHQAKAVDVHSYHLTLSCYQLNSWGDLLKEYLTTSIDRMMKTSSQFRQGLPLDYLQYMGEAQQPSASATVMKEKKRLRSEFHQKGKELVAKMLETVTFDHAADLMGKKFIWDSLPPVFTTEEKEQSSVEDGERMKNGEILGSVELTEDVEVRLARRYCARLVREDGNVRVYFNLENSLEYHGEDAQFVEIPQETENAIAALINSYPAYIKIAQLPTDEPRITSQVISDFWDRRIVVTKEKLPEAVERDDEDENMEEGENEIDDQDEDDSDEDSD